MEESLENKGIYADEKILKYVHVFGFNKSVIDLQSNLMESKDEATHVAYTPK